MKNLGMALHAIQDLYAHTTYVEWQDRRRNGCKVGEIPLWRFTNSVGTPEKPGPVITGNYAWPLDDAAPPTHKELNKDSAKSDRGRTKNSKGVTFFELAEDAATRASEKACKDLLARLPKELRDIITVAPPTETGDSTDGSDNE